MSNIALSRWTRLGAGNSPENFNLVTDPGRDFVVIMKDRKIYKNVIR